MSTSNKEQETQNWMELVRRQVETLQFGVVQIVVHESKVVQIEKTEKVRIADALSRGLLQSTLPHQTTGGTNHVK